MSSIGSAFKRFLKPVQTPDPQPEVIDMSKIAGDDNEVHIQEEDATEGLISPVADTVSDAEKSASSETSPSDDSTKQEDAAIRAQSPQDVIASLVKSFDETHEVVASNENTVHEEAAEDEEPAAKTPYEMLQDTEAQLNLRLLYLASNQSPYFLKDFKDIAGQEVIALLKASKYRSLEDSLEDARGRHADYYQVHFWDSFDIAAALSETMGATTNMYRLEVECEEKETVRVQAIEEANEYRVKRAKRLVRPKAIAAANARRGLIIFSIDNLDEEALAYNAHVAIMALGTGDLEGSSEPGLEGFVGYVDEPLLDANLKALIEQREEVDEEGQQLFIRTLLIEYVLTLRAKVLGDDLTVSTALPAEEADVAESDEQAHQDEHSQLEEKVDVVESDEQVHQEEHSPLTEDEHEAEVEPISYPWIMDNVPAQASITL